MISEFCVLDYVMHYVIQPPPLTNASDANCSAREPRTQTTASESLLGARGSRTQFCTLQVPTVS